MIKKIHKIGDSKCVIIPSWIVKAWELNKEIDINISEERIILTKPKDKE